MPRTGESTSRTILSSHKLLQGIIPIVSNSLKVECLTSMKSIVFCGKHNLCHISCNALECHIDLKKINLCPEGRLSNFKANHTKVDTIIVHLLDVFFLRWTFLQWLQERPNPTLSQWIQKYPLLFDHCIHHITTSQRGMDMTESLCLKLSEET